ncbi:hypothetical protein [Cohnella zeiphila]|uniref:Uncharacterized protein n=1 Tax=Cohnella zeiphila TaxID=2761120 RepID=A0A7X0SS07_9BACL|nr:hypothetical protein [Cohnella zeiphila]MBB6735073.1 hypothetical protein [Cohnella zeiphila]
MFAKHVIYKHDSYNMLTVEVQGKTLVVREISEQWGEECHKFLSRAEMMDWAERHFRAEDFPRGEDQLRETLAALRDI